MSTGIDNSLDTGRRFNSVVEAGGLFDQPNGIQSFRDRYAQFNQLFMVDISPMAAHLKTVGDKFAFLHETIRDTYLDLDGCTAAALQNRLIEIRRQLNADSEKVAELHEKVRLFADEMDKLVQNAVIEVSGNALINLIANKIMQSELFLYAFENGWVDEFLEELLKNDFTLELSGVKVQMPDSQRYIVLFYAVKKVLDNLNGHYEITPDTYNQFLADLKTALLSDFVVDIAAIECSDRAQIFDSVRLNTDIRDDDIANTIADYGITSLYGNVVLSKNCDEFIDNIDKYRQWLINYDFSTQLTDIAGEALSDDLKTKIIILAVAKIRGYLDIDIEAGTSDMEIDDQKSEILTAFTEDLSDLLAVSSIEINEPVINVIAANRDFNRPLSGDFSDIPRSIWVRINEPEKAVQVSLDPSVQGVDVKITLV